MKSIAQTAVSRSASIYQNLSDISAVRAELELGTNEREKRCKYIIGT